MEPGAQGTKELQDGRDEREKQERQSNAFNDLNGLNDGLLTTDHGRMVLPLEGLPDVRSLLVLLHTDEEQ